MKLFWVCSTSCFIFCGGVKAQIPVQDEPRHKVVLENEYVRLLDGRIPANDTTLMHIHAANSVVVFFSKSKFGIQSTGEKPVIAEVNPGEVAYRAYGDKPVNHKVWDESETVFRFWVAELAKQHLGRDACSALSSTRAELQWQEKLVSAYKLRIDRGNHINLPKSNCAYLLLAISEVTFVDLLGSLRPLQGGDFFFFPPLSEIKISNDSREMATAVLLEIK